MAHQCPECGQMCYCNGDIDDCCFDFDDDVDACTCCYCEECKDCPCCCDEIELDELSEPNKE